MEYVEVRVLDMIYHPVFDCPFITDRSIKIAEINGKAIKVDVARLDWPAFLKGDISIK
jgi:hypothetical protein